MKIKKLALIIFFIVLMSGCGVIESGVKDQIIAPNNDIPPILGKWEISEIIYKVNLNDIDINNKVGEVGLFHQNAVVIGSEYSSSPEFKIKRVKARDYLIYKYKLDPSSLGLEDEFVKVVTIYNEKKYFKEFILLDEDNAIIYNEEAFYNMKRLLPEVSEEEVKRYIDVEESVQRSFGNTDSININSGLLLGLKVQSFDEKNEIPRWDYKTYWINVNNKSSITIYELDKLLLPRRNGFWFIDSERIVENNLLFDELNASALLNLDNKQMIGEDLNFDLREKASLEAPMIPSVLKNILFVGNDYISIENIDLNRNSRRTLQIYAIDNLKEKKPIKLSDLIGEDGTNLFQEAASSTIALNNEIVANEENVSLVRRNGYWTLKGRVNYKENNEELYKDFNIKAIPPKEMVSYDELSLPWDAIRLTVPDVVDVFSSPNSEFIVVITTTDIVLYLVEEYDINKTSVATISLPDDSSIIMSEWAVGRYPNIWQNTMVKNGANRINLE
ncbi:MAG: hypothetical protein RBR71_03935 [Gudongella sp.]|nr:hypothetical protein [Gudongella sp.]